MSKFVEEFFEMSKKKERESSLRYLASSTDENLVANREKALPFLMSMGVIALNEVPAKTPEYLPGFKYQLEILSYRPLHYNNLLQTLASACGVNSRHIELETGDKKTEFVTTDDIMQSKPVPSEEAQKLVGDKRVKELLSTFLDELEELRKKTATSDIVDTINKNKGFVVDATTLREAVKDGEDFPSGYYLLSEKDDVYSVVGPFTECPANYEYTNSLSVELTEVKRRYLESAIKSVMIVESREWGDDPEAHLWVVKMTDGDLTFPVIVESAYTNAEILAKKAASIIAPRFGYDECDLHLVSAHKY